MKTIKNPLFILIAVYILQAVAFYTPYILKNRFDVVERNWDGPAYIVIAKTFYNPALIKKDNYINKYLPKPKQFTEKFPLTSVFIRIFSFVGYEKSMIFVSLLFGLLSILIFYKILKLQKIPKALLVSLVFIFFPPRWFVLQKVGGAEPVFIFFALLSIYFYFKNKYFFSSLALLFATLAKINGLLLWVSFTLIIIFLGKKKIRKLLYYLLPPLGVVVLFLYFAVTFHNFFVYFQTDTRCYESLSLFKKPFGVFDASACYVGSIHLDDMFWFYGLSFLSVIVLIKEKQKEWLLLYLPSFIPMLFLQHIDFSRHGLLLFFFSGIIFAKYIVKKEALIIFVLLLPAVYLYARNFINVNIFIP